MIGFCFFSEAVQTRKGLKKHLFVIVAEKDMEVLAVPITSWSDSRYCNDECILNAGDHKFIKHKSWVDFSKARSYSAVDLYNKINQGILIQADTFAQHVLDIIIARTEISEDLPEKFLSFFSD